MITSVIEAKCFRLKAPREEVMERSKSGVSPRTKAKAGSNKWPYFTICTAPSTMKSKNLKANAQQMLLKKGWGKKKPSKRKKSQKSSSNVRGHIKVRKKKSESYSNPTSVKRKAKKTKSPRRDIENMMLQFLSLKNADNQSELVSKYASDNYKKGGFTEEQTNSILNISSQAQAGLSFNNKRNDKKLKSRDQSKKKFFEYSPKYPIKKPPKSMLKAKVLERRLMVPAGKGKRLGHKISYPTNTSYSNNQVEKQWTQDNRNTTGLNLDPSQTWAYPDDDYATFNKEMLYKNSPNCKIRKGRASSKKKLKTSKDRNQTRTSGNSPVMANFLPISRGKAHKKPVIDRSLIYKKYVKKAPGK
ncbi:unnamed protein product [Moneuplotes crassus]|uniref:Uncharacterized protein n=1 Tax=Euplotes crassus TaxID=5936 RepID=A0AAD1Y4C0_EUPCR|nr:unnamed protein product [Moneuplotes crassus]